MNAQRENNLSPVLCACPQMLCCCPMSVPVCAGSGPSVSFADRFEAFTAAKADATLTGDKAAAAVRAHVATEGDMRCHTCSIACT